MKVLGLSCHYHDSAAALVIDGKIAAAALEERFTRKKHDDSFPENSIGFCLSSVGIQSSDLDYVVFYEKPFIKVHRLYDAILRHAPLTFGLFRNATLSTFGKKLWIRNAITDKLKIPDEKVLFLPHHLSHAASAYLPSTFKKSAIMTIDGVGEWATASIGTGSEKGIKIIKEMRFPNSLGLLYSAFTAFLGFEVNEGEYKVMGMAGYGQPKYLSDINKIVKLNDDGSLTPDMSCFSYQSSHRTSLSSRFTKIFGNARKPKSPFNPKSTEDKRYADIAASIQLFTENTVLKMAEHAKKITGEKNLCLAGGVALNGLSNHNLASKKIFDNVYIQPAAGDAGGSLGAALFVDYYFGSKKREVMKNVYYGQDFNNDVIKKILDNGKINYMKMDDGKLFNFLAGRLAKGAIVGWFQGRFEWGPRALGNRSILADPRNPKMKELVNEKIKFREPFRPFAPSVLFEQASKYFNIKLTTNNLQLTTPYDFMLYVTSVKKDKRKLIPAVTHVDGTSRPQLVKKDINPRYYGLIKTFHKMTGIPMLLNTSFNLSTEPIVSTPRQALDTFVKSGLDILVLENYVVEK